MLVAVSLLLYLTFLFSYGAMLSYATDFYWVPYQVSNQTQTHRDPPSSTEWLTLIPSPPPAR